ncbi:hypothetical protein [Bacillus timonensis]|uniref:hypothetical protein n=1 Tax=Bacillus timonensis TaxID=1033734 RepID=UPI0002897A51|nr:hypothetical protein [Bacillus timonensis]
MRSFPFLQNRKLFFLLLSSLLIISFLFVYFLLIFPLKSELKSANSDLTELNKQLEAIEIGPGLKETQLEENATALQKKVPIKPLLEQFLLNLEQAETVSNSFITSMTFNDDNNGATTTESIAEVENESVVESQNENNADNHEANLPAGVKKLTAFLTVQSPGYFELEQFIHSLENFERITKVEQIAFSGFPEIVSTNQGTDMLTTTLTISTYYYPDLEELIEFDPELDAPGPSNKNNPLVPTKNIE